jgi:hypothetical protein
MVTLNAPAIIRCSALTSLVIWSERCSAMDAFAIYGDTIRGRIMPKIAEKLGFSMRRTVEVRQRNDNQPPNPFLQLLWLIYLRDKIKKLYFSGQV